MASQVGQSEAKLSEVHWTALTRQVRQPHEVVSSAGGEFAQAPWNTGAPPLPLCYAPPLWLASWLSPILTRISRISSQR